MEHENKQDITNTIGKPKR